MKEVSNEEVIRRHGSLTFPVFKELERKSHPEGWLSAKIIDYDESSFKHYKGNTKY